MKVKNFRNTLRNPWTEKILNAIKLYFLEMKGLLYNFSKVSNVDKQVISEDSL